MDSKTKILANPFTNMRQLQLAHFKTEMNGDSNNWTEKIYAQKRLEQEKTTNYTNEYDRLVGELSQTNVPYLIRHTIEQRMKTVKQTYSDSQLAKTHLCTYYICQRFTESTTTASNLNLHTKNLSFVSPTL